MQKPRPAPPGPPHCAPLYGTPGRPMPASQQGGHSAHSAGLAGRGRAARNNATQRVVVLPEGACGACEFSAGRPALALAESLLAFSMSPHTTARPQTARKRWFPAKAIM